MCRIKLLLCALLATVTLTLSDTVTPPNHIIFFLIDDYGFADASYKNDMYNGTAAPPTPSLDALAKSGVRLESYYVNKLCSPTRTALLSGRYAYTIGMDDGVITNGQPSDLPMNLLTIGDHFSRAGWNTSAYGKWDAGMTAWGSTPACRGFDHFRGFYAADEDYFTHETGAAFDYHVDERGASKAPDLNMRGVYTTEAVTSAVQGWVTAQLTARPNAKTFAYVAHQAVHGPSEVPARYINDECEALVPASYPTRLIYCGMVRAMLPCTRNTCIKSCAQCPNVYCVLCSYYCCVLLILGPCNGRVGAQHNEDLRAAGNTQRHADHPQHRQRR
jgi:arylsulfatase B/arylsulfatase I/J